MTLVDDLRTIRVELERVAVAVEENHAVIARHEEQISGARGLSVAIQDVAQEIKSLRKAAYWVGGVIVAGAITFAFSVMALVGG